jgi:hypothetical protein
MKQHLRVTRVREQVAQEAAKIMHEQNVRDYQQAKRKACERLGISGKTSMPGNDEIQRALIGYLELFKSATQPELLLSRRQVAINAMTFLSRFDPRLVGSVLHGTADEHAPVQIHLFADPPELVMQFLLASNISYQLTDRRIQYCDARIENITVCECWEDDTPIELMLFATKALREAPRSPINGKPMQRMNLREVDKLLMSKNK